MGITLAVILVTAGLLSIITYQKSWAVIFCDKPYTIPCKGTPSPDVMIGNKLGNAIFGAKGNDLLNGSLGHDFLYGMTSHDTVIGSYGNDFVLGGNGTDKILGGPGNDKIFHKDNVTYTGPDYSKDYIDCGDGDDEVWLNIKIDNDSVSKNCEILHKG